jgi:hypothetical protein
VKRAFPNNCAQSRLKPARAVVKSREVVVQTCHVPWLRKRDTRNPKDYYIRQFKRDIVWCPEETGNRKAAVIFVDGNNEAAITECEASQTKFTRPKEGEFLKLMMQSSRFFKTDARPE